MGNYGANNLFSVILSGCYEGVPMGNYGANKGQIPFGWQRYDCNVINSAFIQ